MSEGTNVGIFIVLALIIFGIFVGIYYYMGGKSSNAINSISDSTIKIIQSKTKNSNRDLLPAGTVTVKATEEKNNLLYIRIRTAGEDDSGNYTDVWVLGEKNSDKTLTIVNSGETKNSLNTSNYYGKNINNGEITIPDRVATNSGTTYTVTKINAQAFSNANFKGNFEANSVTDIGNQAFSNAKFTGEFKVPNVKTIGESAFYWSTFSGDFNSSTVVSIGNNAFDKSVFTGSFTAPNLKTIGSSVFATSKFTGSFTANNVTSIGNNAFDVATFKSTFSANSVKTIGSSAFSNSLFIGSFNTPNLTSIGNNAFDKSLFGGSFIANSLITVSGSAFSNSPFTGTFTANNLKSIGGWDFNKSKFTSIKANNLTKANVQDGNDNIKNLLTN